MIYIDIEFKCTFKALRVYRGTCSDSIIGCRVVGEVVADSSAALIPTTRVVSVMSLVRAVGTILISSFKTLVSQNHSFIVKTLVVLCELLLLKETTLGYLALAER